MIEEEKQPDNFSPQRSNASAASEEVPLGTSTAAEIELNASPNEEPSLSEVPQLNETQENVTATQNNLENPANLAAESTTGNQAQEVTDVEELKREVEALKAQLEDSNNQCESFKSQYMRIAADFDNFRKRTAKEKEDLASQVKCSTISDLLSVVDNFERARSHIKPQTDGEMTIHKSYQSVYKQLVDSLKRIGVSPMRPEGKEFDPNLYEAVMRQPTDEHPEGTVIEELVRGYFLGERVLRHAMVKVAAPAEEASEDSGEVTLPS
ncbi:MAG: nucleotide exchange factor GrpE [Chamaesiphon sp.]